METDVWSNFAGGDMVMVVVTGVPEISTALYGTITYV